MHEANDVTVGRKPLDKDAFGKDATSKTSNSGIEMKDASSENSSCFLLLCSPCAYICSCSGSSEESSVQMSEEGMFYCSLCEVEVCKRSYMCLDS